jgi:ATP-dependent DNA helicase RecG
VANTLIHREYANAFPSSFIIYKDRVEIKNANKPHIYGQLLPGTFQPYPKNPHLAEIFTQMGRSEELGTGYVVENIDMGKNTSGVIGEKSREKIIELIKANKFITQSEIAKLTGLSIKGVEKNILQLKDKGLITRVGALTRAGTGKYGIFNIFTHAWVKILNIFTPIQGKLFNV